MAFAFRRTAATCLRLAAAARGSAVTAVRTAPRFTGAGAIALAGAAAAVTGCVAGADDSTPHAVQPAALVTGEVGDDKKAYPYSCVLRKPPGFEKLLRDSVQAYPDFPSPGILFQDVFPIFRNPSLVHAMVTLLSLHIQSRFGKPDVVIGLDSRGFLFGPMLASALGCKFVPIRKKGKLPGEVLKASFRKEYGTDHFELQKNSIVAGDRVVIVDDLLATGGTMSAAVSLASSAGASVLGTFTLIELFDLGGYKNVEAPCFTLLRY